MAKIHSMLCGALALSFMAGTAAPVAAAPAFIPSAPEASSHVIDVQNRQQRRQQRNRFETRGNNAYYNGKRGYKQRRAGYRQYNGFWFPSSAFIAGAIIGGALNNGTATRSSSAHVRWCSDRWRTYRASDNTYQPTSGPRRACASPYG